MSVSSDGISPDLGDLRKRATKEPGREDAREVNDPHSWDDDTPLRELIVPETAAQWIGVAAAGLVLLALLWWLRPLLGSFITNLYVYSGLAVLGYTGVVYLFGRRQGIDTYISLDKSILYYGDDADVRLCRDGGVEGRSKLVTPLRDLQYVGLRAVPLTLGDLPWEANKLKSKLVETSAPDEQPVRDRLNQSTVTKHTDTMGTIHVTHASDLSYDEHGRHSDRYADPPMTIDEDVAEDFREQHAELHQQFQQLEKRLQLLKQSNEEMRSLRDSQTVPQFEQMMDGFEDLLKMLNARPTSSSPSENGTSDAVQEVEQKTNERLENT